MCCGRRTAGSPAAGTARADPRLRVARAHGGCPPLSRRGLSGPQPQAPGACAEGSACPHPVPRAPGAWHRHLLELRLRVHVDLAHLAVKRLVLDVDAALVADPLGLVPCPGEELASASPQLGAVTFQHQLVLGTCVAEGTLSKHWHCKQTQRRAERPPSNLSHSTVCPPARGTLAPHLPAPSSTCRHRGQGAAWEPDSGGDAAAASQTLPSSRGRRCFAGGPETLGFPETPPSLSPCQSFGETAILSACWSPEPVPGRQHRLQSRARAALRAAASELPQGQSGPGCRARNSSAGSQEAGKEEPEIPAHLGTGCSVLPPPAPDAGVGNLSRR